MIAVGLLLVWLAVKKEYEPLLLLPIGAGAILANLPLSPMVGEHGMLTVALQHGRGQRVVPAADLRRHRRA
jgi:Na+-transporting methylmalonyl-CoA/oxaloacetate decarboxylase beta subunit